jgi:hypothetical protein
MVKRQLQRANEFAEVITFSQDACLAVSDDFRGSANG